MPEPTVTPPPDGRIAYGRACTWWGPIAAVAEGPPFRGRFTGTMQRGLPACPSCGGRLLEVADLDAWWRGVDGHADAGGDPHYRAFVEWLGAASRELRCWPTYDAARAARAAEVRRRIRRHG